MKFVIPGLLVLLCLAGLPFVGNIRDLPPKGGVPEYVHWMKRMKRFGPVSSITAWGQTAVILHDRQAANEILEKTSKKSSGRPYLEMAHRLCGFQGMVATMQFCDDFKRQRRMMHQQIGTKSSIGRYHETMEEETKILLLRIWREPEKLLQLFKVVTGAIILKVLYGYTIDQEEDDVLVKLIGIMMDYFAEVFAAMSWAVDFVPAIRHLPSSLPGMGFKRMAAHSKKVTSAVANIPYSFAQRRMKKSEEKTEEKGEGNAPACYVAARIEELSSGNGKGESDEKKEEEEGKLAAEDEEAIKYSAANLFAGGADTTSSSLTSFVLAMTLYPDVQRKAQKEIDDVVGRDRLPRFEDRPNLPYVESVVREAHRWMPVTPLGNTHRASEDIVYKEYLIPAGAQIIPSIWWFGHDPTTYRDPDEFDPDRYASPREEPDPRSFVFGFGRRKCPGQFFGDAALYIMLVQVLSLFDIRKGLDGEGNEIEPKAEASPGLISYPVNVRYRITPRKEKEHLLKAIEAEDPWRKKSDARLLREEIEHVLQQQP
ncbi:hypothetical protein CP532_2595 [Ophiocordyceps camponoti-leonardi (nom. inval.)]|nr:hypothetical protein CP532_2595 [Ophiocordyceps camponoti-leonardi (nom. inval.)]